MSAKVKDLQKQIDKASKFMFALARTVGMYPFDQHSRRQLITIKFFQLFWIVLFLQMGYTVYAVRHRGVIEIVDKFTNFIFAIICVHKYMSFLKNMLVYKEIIFNLKHLLWMDTREDEDDINLRFIGIIKMVNSIFIMATFFTSPFYLGLPTTILFIRYVQGQNTTDVLPYGAWYPFKVEDYHPYVYIHEAMVQVFGNTIFMMYDMFTIFIVLFLCFHMKRYQYKFLTITRDLEKCVNEIDYNDALEEQSSISKELDDIVESHNLLLETFEKFNSVLSATFLVTYLICSVALCCTGFMFLAGIDIYKKIRALILLISLCCMMGIQCFIGQELINESDNLADAVYSSKWFLTDTSIKKKFHIILMRCQKPITLTGLNMVNMEVLTFSNIISTAYTYFTLLKRVYDG